MKLTKGRKIHIFWPFFVERRTLRKMLRMSHELLIRVFRHGDERAIAEIFSTAIHEIASEVYTAEQCLAWCGPEVDYERWRKRCELKRPFVAVVNEEIAGFLELDPDGHIDCAYINPRFKRRGIMTRLVQHAVENCSAMNVCRVYVEASFCAQPLFEKAGFRTLQRNVITRNEVELVNFTMERLLPLNS